MGKLVTETVDLKKMRAAIADFDLSPRVEPNADIQLEQAYLPDSHRNVLDVRRQLVVGNRGMGKSFWTHALLNQDLRKVLSQNYRLPALEKAKVVIGFNGSTKANEFAPTPDEIIQVTQGRSNADVFWRAVLMRAVLHATGEPYTDLGETMGQLEEDPSLFTRILSSADDLLAKQGLSILIVFDALDRLARNWEDIRALTKELLYRAVGLQSFSSIRLKIFMREDQFSDPEIFRFPDSSKIKNDSVRLFWSYPDLYGLLFFEISRRSEGAAPMKALQSNLNVKTQKSLTGPEIVLVAEDQDRLVSAFAGEFMGSGKKRGRVYTWVPRHLSDAKHTCAPRTFLTAWKTAAEHLPFALDRAVEYQGLNEGVRRASETRLHELYEDYPWIQPTLEALSNQFVPISMELMFALWEENSVRADILTQEDPVKAPVGFHADANFGVLLNIMQSIGVMEERGNGKINVPDIFRVEAKIKRKGGVSVPPHG